MDQILGLVWSLIVHYRISSVPTPSDEEEDEDSQQPIYGKELLLSWVNTKLPDHGISNFTTDWRDGTKLLALEKSIIPERIPDLSSIDPNEHTYNMSYAMNEAGDTFGIPNIFGYRRSDIDCSDEICVMTFLSFFYQFDKAKQYDKLGK